MQCDECSRPLEPAEGHERDMGVVGRCWTCLLVYLRPKPPVGLQRQIDHLNSRRRDGGGGSDGV